MLILELLVSGKLCVGVKVDNEICIAALDMYIVPKEQRAMRYGDEEQIPVET